MISRRDDLSWMRWQQRERFFASLRMTSSGTVILSEAKNLSRHFLGIIRRQNLARTRSLWYNFRTDVLKNELTEEAEAVKTAGTSMITITTRQGKQVEIVLESELCFPVDMGERVRAFCHIHGSDHQRSLSINKATG